MASKYYKFSGVCKWAKVRKPDEKYDNFSIQLYMDEPSWDLFEQSGLSLIPKEDDEGHYVTFRRPNKKLINGEIANFGPPEVSGIPEGGLIGNGSTVVCDVIVYDTQKGKGHRLNKVTVKEWVKYEFPAEEAATVKEVAQPHPAVQDIITPKAPSRTSKRPF